MPKLLDETAALHQQEYGEPASSVASAPGTLHLLGEHIEYARSHVLSIALQHRAWISVSKRTDSTVRLWAINYQERKRFSLSKLQYKKEDRWANLYKGILNGLANLGCPLHGLNLTLSSDIPEGKGLGASAALAIAAALALLRHFKFDLTAAQIVYLAHGADTTFQGRNGSIAACFVSHHAHAGAVFALDLRSQEYRNLRLSQGEFGFYLVDSLVKPIGAREELAELRQTYEQSRDYLKKSGVQKELRDYELREVKDLIIDLPEPLRRVIHFVVEEHHRLQLAEDTIEASNMPPLGKILTHSHEGLRDELELSCPELDWLAKHGLEVPGILGVRLTGPGLGACAVLFTHGESEASLKTFLAEYERIFGFHPRIVRAIPSHKAQVYELGPAPR